MILESLDSNCSEYSAMDKSVTTDSSMACQGGWLALATSGLDTSTVESCPKRWQ